VYSLSSRDLCPWENFSQFRSPQKYLNLLAHMCLLGRMSRTSCYTTIWRMILRLAVAKRASL
jgi:hypothetical protein